MSNHSSAGSYRSCFSTLGCPEFNLEQVADLAVEFKIPLIELRALNNGINVPETLQAAQGGWSAARDLLDSRGLKAHVLGTSFKLIGSNDKLWSDLWRYAELAEVLRTPYLRVFGGGTWGTPHSDAEYREAADTIRRWDAERQARDWQTQILLETHDGFSGSKPCLRLQELAPRPVEYVWDCHHTWRLAGEAPAESWKALGSLVRHVHIKDSIATSSGAHSHTYVLPGQGEMPAREALRLLTEDGYTGAVSLEWEKKWHPDLEPIADALAAGRKCHWF